jgi:2-dehydro-3-deoxy-D-gluconate 5-dehydrogenase
MKAFSLTGKVALITGGNGGIGRAIALGLAEAGADVVIAARNADKTAQVVEEVRALGRRACPVACDVQRTADLEAALGVAARELGGLDILVNNAGVSSVNLAQAIAEDEWDRVIDTNLKAVFLGCKLAHPLFKARGGGKIINIGSEYSMFGSAFVVSYAASKGGVVQLSKSLAIAWAPDRIQVNTIIPGWIRTDMTAVAEADPNFSRQIRERTPAGRFGEPAELAGAAVFLASPASDFVTGQALCVDGGYSIA